MKSNSARPRLKVTGDGKNVASHVGSRLVADLADKVGLTEGLSVAMAPTRQGRGGHDRDRVLVDLAVSIADGGETISELVVLRDQPDLFGKVASTPTAWRTLEAVDGAALERIAQARAAARARAGADHMNPERLAELALFDIYRTDGRLMDSLDETEAALAYAAEVRAGTVEPLTWAEDDACRIERGVAIVRRLGDYILSHQVRARQVTSRPGGRVRLSTIDRCFGARFFTTDSESCTALSAESMYKTRCSRSDP